MTPKVILGLFIDLIEGQEISSSPRELNAMLALVDLEYLYYHVYFIVVLQNRHLAFVLVLRENKVFCAVLCETCESVEKLVKRGFRKEFSVPLDSLQVSFRLSS